MFLLLNFSIFLFKLDICSSNFFSSESRVDPNKSFANDFRAFVLVSFTFLICFSKKSILVWSSIFFVSNSVFEFPAVLSFSICLFFAMFIFSFKSLIILFCLFSISSICWLSLYIISAFIFKVLLILSLFDVLCLIMKFLSDSICLIIFSFSFIFNNNFLHASFVCWISSVI